MSHRGFQYCHPELTLEFDSKSTGSMAERCWSTVQRSIAAFCLVGCIPLFALLWVLVKGTSEGPFIFKQKRRGLYGNMFDVFKIRTMKRDSESVSLLGVNNTSFCVTRVGRVLRILKLDELPQLWNVARGDMALVGPRPIPLALDNKLSDEIPGFQKRYDVKPGLTSIGQICIHDNQLDDGLVKDWKIRFEGELHYMRNRSVSYDLLMIVMTTLYVLRKLLPTR